MRRRTVPLLCAAALAAGSLTAACGSGSGSSPDTVKVSFHQATDNNVRIMDKFLASVKKQFEKKYPDKKVKLVPIKAPDAEYYTKLQQMLRSPKTAPDLAYEDTFLINSDITSGYLLPIDKYLKSWKDWPQFIDSAKTAARGQDGKTYGVPDGTDTRGIWFNKDIFKKAGLPADWQPKSWDDILAAARTIKQKVPGVMPLNVYTGKPGGEQSAMQGFEMLLYGTGKDPLYDPASKKWVVGSQGYKDTLKFIQRVFKEKLGPDAEDALDPNSGLKVRGDWLPKGKLAIDIDGSWLPQDWIKGAAHEWPEWSKTMGLAYMPTQHGQAPGKVSLSGGWTWAIPAKAGNPDLAWKFIKMMQTKENAEKYNLASSGIAVRNDVAQSQSYLTAQPHLKFFTDLVKVTQYRPAYPDYPKISTAIQESMDPVTTGDGSPEDAAKKYDDEVKSITDGKVIKK